MFDIGFWELFMIGLVALLVIGPERLPKVAYEIGRWTSRIRRWITNARADLDAQLNSTELRELLQSQQKEINSLKNMLGDVQNDVNRETQYIARSFEEAIQGTGNKPSVSTDPHQNDVDALKEPAPARDVDAELEKELGQSFSKPDFSGGFSAGSQDKKSS